MMLKAYVVLAHKNPAQVLRLIQSLDDGLSVFFVHIDRRADANQFSCLLPLGKRVRLVPRVKTEWASFGLVEAVLNGLQAIRQSKEKIEHVILLSGQDYPIKSNEYINEFLDSNGGRIYLEHHSIPDHKKWTPNGGLYRVNKYYMGLKSHQRYAARTANFMSGLLPFLRRKQYHGMEAFGGSMWWIMSRYAMEYILDFVAENPRYAAFHRFTFAPDELFFHMILLNSTDERIRASIVNDDKRFIKWKDLSASHPENLGREDLDQLSRSGALFARKFDLAGDEELFDLVDERCNTGARAAH